MLVRHYVPQPPLSDFVDILWLYEGYSQLHDKERLLPNGCMELVINLREDQARVYDRRDTSQFQTTRGAILVGVQSEFFVLDTAEQRSVIGAHFKPGGAYPFFIYPPANFTINICRWICCGEPPHSSSVIAYSKRPRRTRSFRSWKKACWLMLASPSCGIRRSILR